MIYVCDCTQIPANAACSAVRRAELDRLGGTPTAQLKRGAEAALWTAFSAQYPGYAYPFDYPRTAAGKPFFPDHPDFHFSLAHDGGLAVCTVMSSPCGVDILRIGRVSDALIKRRMHPLQREYLAALPESERAAAAAQMWCMLEAYAKLDGAGIAGIEKDFYALPNGQSNQPTLKWDLFSPADGYCGAVCAENLAEPLEIIRI